MRLLLFYAYVVNKIYDYDYDDGYSIFVIDYNWLQLNG